MLKMLPENFNISNVAHYDTVTLQYMVHFIKDELKKRKTEEKRATVAATAAQRTAILHELCVQVYEDLREQIAVELTKCQADNITFDQCFANMTTFIEPALQEAFYSLQKDQLWKSKTLSLTFDDALTWTCSHGPCYHHDATGERYGTWCAYGGDERMRIGKEMVVDVCIWDDRIFICDVCWNVVCDGTHDYICARTPIQDLLSNAFYTFVHDAFGQRKEQDEPEKIKRHCP